MADEQVRERIDDAIHRAAASFADRISTGRTRSRREQRLVGGYWFTEARRRLADRLVITDSARGEPSLVYIPEQHRDDVIEFLAVDLARRANLMEDTLASAFDLLVDNLRAVSNQLAGQRMTFERPADTARLKARLLTRFGEARCAGGAVPLSPPKKDQSFR
jgi:plasmid stabilization system protein ParE